MKKAETGIRRRKEEHLRYALMPESQGVSNGLENVKLPYCALPDKSLEDVDLSTTFLNKKIAYPFFISCMTGGPLRAKQINIRLAKTAQKYNIPMGVGSMRIALRYPELADTFQVRKLAPDIPLLANLGASSLNDGLSWKDCQRAVELIEADALVLHLNPLQEALQPGGSTDFRGLLIKIEEVVKKIKVPVIVKEVGHGIDGKTARDLYNAGVKIIDTAGTGGTSWAWIEAKIAGDEQGAAAFKDFGLNTYESIKACIRVKGLTVLGSGGIRTGLAIAKVLHMGGSLAGLAYPFLVAALESEEASDKLCERLINELKIAIFCQSSSTPL